MGHTDKGFKNSRLIEIHIFPRILVFWTFIVELNRFWKKKVVFFQCLHFISISNTSFSLWCHVVLPFVALMFGTSLFLCRYIIILKVRVDVETTWIDIHEFKVWLLWVFLSCLCHLRSWMKVSLSFYVCVCVCVVTLEIKWTLRLLSKLSTSWMSHLAMFPFHSSIKVFDLFNIIIYLHECKWKINTSTSEMYIYFIYTYNYPIAISKKPYTHNIAQN
jgi:hypothetical protein